MAQRMFNLSKWSHLKEGWTLYYENPKPRLVVLEVNCPAETCFWVLQDPRDVENSRERVEDRIAGRTPSPGADAAAVDEDNPPSDDGRAVTFLGRCIGRDRLEFHVDGAFSLMSTGSSASVYTADSQDVTTRIVAPVIFTKIANRRARNPHLEMIEYQAKLNLERRMQQLEVEVERRLTDRVNKYADSTALKRVADKFVAREPEPESEGAPEAPAGDSGADEAKGGGGKKAREKRATAALGDD